MDFEATTIPIQEENIDAWAFLEIMGHTTCAGRLTTRKIGTEVMLQIDITKGETGFSHSVLYGPKAIFSISPTTEAWCRKYNMAREKYDRSPLPYIPEGRQLASPLPEGEGQGEGDDPEDGHFDREM
ncbi:MAG: hypothetical protein M1469_01170 [Bacteroidetes bacterium]|nr:hypothetical protein [Bacteroidota bacterium]